MKPRKAGCEFKNVFLFQISDRQERLCRSQHHLTSPWEIWGCLSPCRTRVVSPIMDVIDWQTFQYNATQWPVRGVFDWKLDFHWESNPQLQDKDPESAVQSLRWVLCQALQTWVKPKRKRRPNVFIFLCLMFRIFSRKLQQMRAMYQHKGKTAWCLTYFLTTNGSYRRLRTNARYRAIRMTFRDDSRWCVSVVSHGFCPIRLESPETSSSLCRKLKAPEAVIYKRLFHTFVRLIIQSWITSELVLFFKEEVPGTKGWINDNKD